MADRLEWFSVTIPAGTLQASPVTIPCVFAYGTVTEIDVKVPPGPSGNLGFFIGAGGSQYWPRTPGSYIVPDDDYLTWPVTNAINSGSWFVTGYNLDIYDHTIQVSFQINEIGLAHVVPASAQLASSNLLASAAALVQPETAPIDPLSPDALLASLQASLT